MGKEYPVVSVLIPAYNSEKFIQCAIESCLRQTFSDLEIVVLDDGSKDRTREVVAAIMKDDSRVRYFYQENQGLSNTRTRLVQLAIGNVVAFLDHDDEWLPDKTEKQLKLLEKDKSIGLIFSDIYIKRNGKIVGRRFKENKPFRGDVFYKYLFSDNFVPLITAMFQKKTLLEFLPFNPEYIICEEFDIFLKIARKYKFDYVDEPLAIYNLHGNNEVILKWQKLIEEDFAILNYWRKLDPSIDKLYKKRLNRRFSQLYYAQGSCYSLENNVSGLKNAIFNSLKYQRLNFNALKLSMKLFLNIIRARV